MKGFRFLALYLTLSLSLSPPLIFSLTLSLWRFLLSLQIDLSVPRDSTSVNSEEKKWSLFKDVADFHKEREREKMAAGHSSESSVRFSPFVTIFFLRREEIMAFFQSARPTSIFPKGSFAKKRPNRLFTYGERFQRDFLLLPGDFTDITSAILSVCPSGQPVYQI